MRKSLLRKGRLQVSNTQSVAVGRGEEGLVLGTSTTHYVVRGPKGERVWVPRNVSLEDKALSLVK